LALGSFLPNSKGKVFLLQTDLLPIEDRSMFQAVACAILIANQGSLSEQVKRMIRKIEIPNRSKKITTTSENISNSSLKNSDLEFYNEIGGFDVDNNEYVINLKNNIVTPLPWINVIANESFGFQVSESGAGYTWSKNSRENQLTPWTNDPVIDLTGECFYFYDMDTFELWSPTLAPIRIENANYAIRNGQGYSIFEVSHNGILSNLTQFVHPFLSLKISKIYLKNDHKIKKNIKVTSYNELVLGFTRSNSSRFIVTGYDFESEKMIAQNPWSQEFSQCVLFAGFVDGNDSWTGNRKEFIGRNSELSNPISFANNKRLSKKVGAGFDSCAAIDKEITLLPGEEKVLVFVLGQGDDIHKARYFSQIVTTSNVDEIFISTKNKWKKLLNQIQIETPNIAMNILVNHWLLYQTISCRLWARSAFYQSGGAFGFRDQLQDSMATIWVNPDLTKSQILKAAARQFVEGDVQHWWHLPSGRGVRTHFSDDLLWLPFIVTYYLEHTHDQLILEMEVPFISGTLLEKNREDSYFIPDSTLDFGNIYEHCARALDYSLSTGIHGLPLIGGGDWNDGMNRVGHAGKGESVWLTWFLISNLESFSKLANQRGEILRYEKWKHHIQLLKVAVEASAWDGEWYKRAFYDDGTPLGSRESEECVIDSISQSWAVISGAANVERTKTAMDSVEKKLINYEKKLILLFTPPFNKTLKDPGYIKGYLPGVRENGGQYTHAAIWNALAFSKLKNGNKAVELFDLLNPINHTSSLNEVLEYKVEPYVMAADIYSVSPNEGRGGWTWYTGAAGWMYTLAIENILGLKIQGKTLTIDPCIHSDWDFYKICYQYIDTKYEIEVKNPNKLQTGLRRTVHDGQVLDKSKDSINLINDLKIHYISIELY
jgi:cyclic beta-1,2-glucan synthetase